MHLHCLTTTSPNIATSDSVARSYRELSSQLAARRKIQPHNETRSAPRGTAMGVRRDTASAPRISPADATRGCGWVVRRFTLHLRETVQL
jgi:hypothetical protein